MPQWMAKTVVTGLKYNIQNQPSPYAYCKPTKRKNPWYGMPTGTLKYITVNWSRKLQWKSLGNSPTVMGISHQSSFLRINTSTKNWRRTLKLITENRYHKLQGKTLREWPYVQYSESQTHPPTRGHSWKRHLLRRVPWTEVNYWGSIPQLKVKPLRTWTIIHKYKFNIKHRSQNLEIEASRNKD